MPPMPSIPVPPERNLTPSPLRKGSNVPKAVIELEKPIAEVKGAIGRGRTGDNSARDRQVGVLFEVFERVDQVNALKTVGEGLNFLLDLALEKIPSESASVLRSNLGTGELSFSVVRGPKAKELAAAKITLSPGEGIAGFCAAEGVSLAVADVQKDPRHFHEVASRIGYQPRSILCSPMMVHGRVFGVMQLLNRQGSETYTEHELGLLSYVAHQAAVFLSRHWDSL
jgi:signal transduction protein with GAF and PtsI domain